MFGSNPETDKAEVCNELGNAATPTFLYTVKQVLHCHGQLNPTEVCSCPHKQTKCWRTVLWPEQTKIKLFIYKNQKVCLKDKSEAFKSKNAAETVMWIRETPKYIYCCGFKLIIHINVWQLTLISQREELV